MKNQYVGECLPVEEMAAGFNEARGRLTQEVQVMVGALILQQMFDLPDEETI